MFQKIYDLKDIVTIQIDDVPVAAEAGETVAAVLLRQSEAWVRLTPVAHVKRAPYCMMGVCFDCLAEIDGVSSVQTCLTVVREGMVVRRQSGPRSIAR